MTNVLKPYLADQLPETFELNDGEVIADALVVVRILDLSSGEPFIPERYEYTTSQGLSFAMARGLVENVRDELRDFHVQTVNLREERDDDGDR